MSSTVVTIRLDSGKELELSVEDARSAQRELNQLFARLLSPTPLPSYPPFNPGQPYGPVTCSMQPSKVGNWS